ncbi:MAG TPA: hypothetical protein VJV58_03800 [Bradyrhizobium sp.]|uniref:hypothetical protein n=1 Tax=Bradyrhizobium sp. TaxID=376 RepID=UPI002B45F8FF|nr:hypothetical protein [Bradyrhizobium sp.]HKO70037.1 hypothetical protein [Bradyrhizobium sp.]
MGVTKLGWQQIGHVTEPGRYMFRFGWLTVAPSDLAIWQQFPNAVFALVKTASAPIDVDGVEEFHLGAFDLREERRQA